MLNKLRYGAVLKSRVVRNTGWLLADKLLRIVLLITVAAWMARYFGPSRFGLFNYAQALVWLFSLIAALGLESVVVRDIIRRPEDRARILASAFVLRLCAAGLAAVVCVALVIVMRPGDREAWLLVAILSLSLLPQAAEVIDYGYKADVNAKPVVVLRNATLAFSSVLRIAVMVAGGSLLAVAITFVIEPVIFGALLFLRSHRDRLRLAPADWSRKECRHLLDQSWPLMISNASIAIYMRIDQLMLAQMVGDRAVGVLSAAIKISETWWTVPMAVMVSVSPGLTALYQRSVADFEKELLRISRMLTWLAIASAAALGLASPLIIRLLYGPEFSAAAPVLAIHAWASVFVCLGLIGTCWLVTIGHTRHVMWQTVSGAIANVILNVFLISAFGVIGAALATVASQCLTTLLYNSMFGDTRPLFRLQLRVFGLATR